MSDLSLRDSILFRDLYIRIDPKSIAFLKFIIEGYDGLALLTTIDRRDGLVKLLVPTSRHDELWKLLAELAHINRLPKAFATH